MDRESMVGRGGNLRGIIAFKYEKSRRENDMLERTIC